MNRAVTRQVQVVHALPGRLRVRLEAPSEVDQRSIEATVGVTPGVRRASFSPYTSNILIEYDPTVVSSNTLLLHLRRWLSIPADGEGATSSRDPASTPAANLPSERSRAPGARIIPFPSHRARMLAPVSRTARPLARRTAHLATPLSTHRTVAGARQIGWLPSLLIAMDESPLLPLLLRAMLGRRRATLISHGIGFARLVLDHQQRLGTTLQMLGAMTEMILE